MNLSDNEIEQVEYELLNLQIDICQWVQRKYHRRIMASIQLIHQKQKRPLACNILCSLTQKEDENVELCNKSDEAMKVLLSERLKNSRDKDISIGYLCHKGMSNIVIPYHDKKCRRGTYWYVFLGQFVLKGCRQNKKTCDEIKCHTCFGDEKIKILKPKDIEDKYSDCVHAGIICNPKYLVDEGKVERENILSIPQLIMCKFVTKNLVANFFDELHSEINEDSGRYERLERLEKWVQMNEHNNKSTNKRKIDPRDIEREKYGNTRTRTTSK